MGFGSPQKDVKDEVRQKFLSRLEKTLKKLNKKAEPDLIYVFVPDYIRKDVEKLVSKYISQNVGQTFSGNFFKHKPLKLLEMIKKQAQERKTEPLSEEAKKILEKGES